MALPPELSRACFRRDGWRCRHCGDSSGLHPHHVVYKSHGGKDELNNLLTLCWKCHRGHHDGKLDITVVKLLPSDLVVKFIRKDGWKPV
jgi:5-methylcytosine-specific restriction endonuclease McrA